MPPPPPPAPPPLPKSSGAANNHGKSNNFEPPPDRNALLSQIKKGTRLKKSETNDRSAPIVGGGKSSSNGTVRQNTDNKSNAPYPIIPPGGLFAQGIPKLRPTVPKSGDNPALSSLVIQSLKTGKSSSLDHLRISGSRSQPPSPVSKPRMSSGVSSQAAETRENTSGSNPNFPDDVNIKGPAPAPPPASQKPVFRSNAGDNDEQAPSKLTTVKRSASQTNLGQRPRLCRPPPNVKPPPPPKSNVAPPQTAPPPPPSKPPNILRRQSFGVGEGQNLRLAANKVSASNNTFSKATGKNIGPPPPPPPPRNNSAPQDLNQMVSSSSPNNHWSKMNIAPPPPPNRIVASSNRNVPIRPPPPRLPAPPPPPPPPQHQFSSHPAPPSQMKATPSSNYAPPPPARISSMKQNADFEDRFKFHPAQSLPKPERFPNTTKSYSSRANLCLKQSTRRQPPPPPPQSGVSDSARSQPVLHIQLDSGIFSNNFAHS